MSRIIKIVRAENKGDRAKITALLDDGTECTIWVGGEVEVFYHQGQVRGFVKKTAQPKE